MKPWQKLLSWFDHEGRKLPWRGTRDPYRILVSEIMLQQTQVSRVIDFYRTWMKKFPTWNALAKASNSEIIHTHGQASVTIDVASRSTTSQNTSCMKAYQNREKHGSPSKASAPTLPTHSPFFLCMNDVGRSIQISEESVVDSAARKTYPQPSDDDRIRKHADKSIPTSGRYFDIPQAAFDLATSICTKTPACSIFPMKPNASPLQNFLPEKLKLQNRW